MKLNGDYVADMAELHLGRIFAAVFFSLISPESYSGQVSSVCRDTIRLLQRPFPVGYYPTQKRAPEDALLYFVNS